VEARPSRLGVGSCPCQGSRVGTFVAWACCERGHRRDLVVELCCAGGVAGVEGVEVVPSQVAFARGLGEVGVEGSV